MIARSSLCEPNVRPMLRDSKCLDCIRLSHYWGEPVNIVAIFSKKLNHGTTHSFISSLIHKVLFDIACAEVMFWKISWYENANVHYFNLRLFFIEFAKTKDCRNAPIRFAISACLFACRNSANRRTDFHEIWFWASLLKFVDIFYFLSISGILYVNLCAFLSASWAWLAKYLSKRNSFQTELAENSETRLLYPLHFLHMSYGKVKLSLCLIN
jgi:hypothetical protein